MMQMIMISHDALCELGATQLPGALQQPLNWCFGGRR